MRLILILLLIVPTLQAQIDPAAKCGFGNHRHSLDRTASPQERRTPDLDESLVSPAGFFRIHFTQDTSSFHAVVDTNSVGTPSFVLEAAIAADSAYTILVDQLGFLPPLPDQDIDGPELDIYIVDMKSLWYAGSYYGMTYFEPYTPSPTYLLVDNDYTESFYATSGLNALQVTIAHEFFHMVQLRYSHPAFLDWANLFWYEISSVWFEEYCYPDIDDYHAYVSSNFSAHSFPALDNMFYMYGHGIYGQVLDKEYGQRTGKHVMLDLWENLSDKDAINNLKSTLSSSPWNSSFTHSLERYAIYNIFTGERSIVGEYYDDAPLLPQVRTKELILSTTAMNTLDYSIIPRGIYYSTFSIVDGFVEFISRTESSGDISPSHFQVYYPGSEFYDLKRLSANTWSDEVHMNPGVELIQVSINPDTLGISCKTTILPQMDFLVISPNPINPSQDELQLNFTRPLAEELPLEIYNILGQLIYSETRQFPDGFIQTSLQLNPIMASGLYILRIGTGKTANIQKFTVLK